MRLAGVGVSGGRSCAEVYVFAGDPSQADFDAVQPQDPASGHELLDQAIERARIALIDVEATTAQRFGTENAAIFHANRLILDDDEWLGPIRTRIDGGEPAAGAVWQVSEELAAELGELEDEYLRARAVDIVDVGKRVLGQLGLNVGARLPGPVEGEVIVVAHELSPSDTIDLDPTVVRGIVTEFGTRTSHAAILARQLGIPAVVAVSGLLDAVYRARLIAIDGDTGVCQLDPTPEVQAHHRALGQAADPVVRRVVTTLDDLPVTVAANASSAQEVADAVAAGADAIGLYRTEFLFLRSSGTPPDEDAQADAYCAAAEAADGRWIIFRTLDVGADKSVPGIQLPADANPFLGMRGIRFSLDERSLFEIQLRALARASRKHENVRVMVPMVSGPRELRAVAEILAELGAQDALKLGAMIEVPSAALLVPEMASLVRFFSVGTNDLTGYMLAADRTNMALGDLYDELHPGVLRCLRLISGSAADAGIPVSICGDLAGEPLSVPLLIGLGYDSLSVATPLVARIKAAVAAVNRSEARELAVRALACGDAHEVRALLARTPAAVG
jgi:phosphoenolpyruvate-protein phosphotransferase